MALTALQVRNAKAGDKLSDGRGLRLDVDRAGNKSWIFRYTSPVTRKERYMGIGSFRDVSLSDARDTVQEARTLIRDGKDPIEHRKEQRAEATMQASRSITFREYAERHISGKEPGWKNPKHRQQWRNTLRDYAYPIIGGLSVADIDTPAVLKVLRPIWEAKKETASRVRGRIEAILSAAKAEGLRTGENPALWRGHLNQLLSKRRKFEIEHHAALPYDEIPKFWKSLATDTSDAARMLRFIILTACRYTEAAGMNASEISGDLWTIPATRMKAGEKHEVPLTSLALEQLPCPPVSDVSLNKCIVRHTTLPATTHGFRSTFRDWAGDCTAFAREVAEAALAHAVGNKTEAACRRSTALAKRRELMVAWTAFCYSV